MKQLRRIHYTLANVLIVITMMMYYRGGVLTLGRGSSQQILNPINSVIVSREEKNSSKIMKWKIFPII